MNPNLDAIVAGPMRLVPGSVPDEAQDAAAAFLDALWRDADRRSAEWDEELDRLGDPDPLIVSICGRSYLPFLERMVASWEQCGSDAVSRAVVMALDADTAERCRQLGLGVVAASVDGRSDVHTPLGFGDPGYSWLVPWKSVAMLDALHRAERVLLTDVDVIWFVDPLADLADRAGPFQVSAMFDGRSVLHRPFHANSGFMYVVADDVTRATWHTILGNVAAISSWSEQATINRILAHFHAYNVLRIQVLPESRYLNGHLFNLVTGVSDRAGNWRDEGLVLHYSWTGNPTEKLAKLEMLDLG